MLHNVVAPKTDLCHPDAILESETKAENMATIRSREDQDGITIGWQAQIKRKGFPLVVKTCMNLSGFARCRRCWLGSTANMYPAC